MMHYAASKETQLELNLYECEVGRVPWKGCVRACVEKNPNTELGVIISLCHDAARASKGLEGDQNSAVADTCLEGRGGFAN